VDEGEERRGVQNCHSDAAASRRSASSSSTSERSLGTAEANPRNSPTASCCRASTSRRPATCRWSRSPGASPSARRTSAGMTIRPCWPSTTVARMNLVCHTVANSAISVALGGREPVRSAQASCGPKGWLVHLRVRPPSSGPAPLLVLQNDAAERLLPASEDWVNGSSAATWFFWRCMVASPVRSSGGRDLRCGHGVFRLAVPAVVGPFAESLLGLLLGPSAGSEA